MMSPKTASISGFIIVKNNTIPAGFKAPGLKEARQFLRYEDLSEEEKLDYEHHLKQWVYEKSAIETAGFKGENRGLAKGLAQCEAERTRLEGELEQKTKTLPKKTKTLPKQTKTLQKTPSPFQQHKPKSKNCEN